MLQEVPEHMIERAARMLSDDPTNSFIYLLSAGKKFKEAGLTPVYFYDPDINKAWVTTEERSNKKLH